MQKKNFIRKNEDFTCNNCMAYVKGNGYTNHCPKCLCSKHVDLNIPGDRMSSCNGIMKPINLEIKNNEYIITHKCIKCNRIKKNTVSKDDNFEALLSIKIKKYPYTSREFIE